MSAQTNIRRGQCHCGTVRFEATLAYGFNSIRRCNCSYCRMRGAVVVSAEMGGIKVLQGEHALTSYRFNTRSHNISSVLAAEYTPITKDDLTRTNME